MTLRWIEGFEWLASGEVVGTDLTYRYAAAGLSGSSDNSFEMLSASDRNGGVALWSKTLTNYYLETPAFTAHATWVVGFAFKTSSFEDTSPTSETILEIVDGSTVHARIRLGASTTSSSGYLEVVRGDGTSFGTSSALAIDTWYYVELKVTINDSTGSIVFRIDETEVFNLTSQDTRNGGNATADRVRLYLGWANTSAHLKLDDWYVCDGAGSSPNNNFLGDSHVEGILPNGAGNSTQRTPSSGNNYQAVDDTTPDGSSTYVQSSTPGDKDLYAFGNLTRITGDISGVQVTALTRNTNAATPRTVKVKARSSSTEASGSDVTLPSDVAYHPIFGVFETDPNTSSAWAASTVNAAELGIELVS